MEVTHVHALDYLSAVRRRKWWLVVPIVLSVFVGLALVRFLPKEYRSIDDARRRGADCLSQSRQPDHAAR